MPVPNPVSRVRRAGLVWTLLGALCAALVGGSHAGAQLEERRAPPGSYYASFGLLYDGNFRDALARFQSELRGGIRVGLIRWIDSICYYTMVGECYYHMGDLPRALNSYTAAVELYLADPAWMTRIQFPAAIQPSRSPPQTPWGASTRGAVVGEYPRWMPSLQGRIDNTEQYRGGGVVQQAVLYPVGAPEIARSTALAIRRRAELLGPLSKHDPLNKRLLEVLSQPVGPRNHWSASWTDVQLGMALLANGRSADAAVALNRGALAAGQFVHPLTPMALLELGRLQLEQGAQAAAANLFLEATYAAYHYGDVVAMEEAFRYGALTHLISNQRGVYPPLAIAAQWARQKDCRFLEASLLLSGAENSLALGETGRATALLAEAQSVIGRRTMGAGRIGARLKFLQAAAWFQQGKIGPGEEALLAAMAYMKAGSLWLFHIAQVDAYVSANLKGSQIASRTALDLCQQVLRDPQPSDWAWDPMEALAVLMTPHAPALERWFLVALRRTDQEAALPMALEIADRVRRHRFFSSLAYGGRLHALRWVLEAPPEALDHSALVQRESLLAQYPGYKALSERARQLRAALAAMPLAPSDPETQKTQQAAFAELGTLSLQQETILRQIALRREPAALVYPPLRSVKEVQQALPGGTAVLVFFAAQGELHGFLLNHERCHHWIVKGAGQLPKRITAFLRELGNYELNRELGSKELNNPQWRQTGREILAILLEGSRADFGQKFPELVVVPDGSLWYLPFEALTVKADDRLEPLLMRVRVRYAPTMSLAIADRRGRRLDPETAVVLGRLHPQEDATVSQGAFQQLSKAISRTVALERLPLPAPAALLKVCMDQLIVLDDLGMPNGTDYAWAPLSIDRGKPGSALGDWMALPWGAPEVVVLPGFQTAAGTGFRRGPRGADGAELFCSVCGLLASGTRTILISRWRTGGQSAIDLVREFAQELPHTTPADAWQRAVLLLAQSRLDPKSEPRLKQAGPDEVFQGDHPFFWSGYMLVDAGQVPEKAGAPPAGKPSPEGQKPHAPDQPAKPGQADKAPMKPQQ
ncbi:MAG: CHAT domain-containing protein [Thermoguttaceae bacterium]